MKSPLTMEPLFAIGPLPITPPVVITWAIMLALVAVSALARRRLALAPSTTQTMLEILVDAIDGQIRDVIGADPAPYRAIVGGIFVFVLCANWSSLIPGVEPPTARLETDAALALVVFGATIAFGVRARGLGGYLRGFAEPTWAMIPLNVVEQFTRAFSLVVRLFGNVMSGVFILAIVLSLAGLLVPIPLMALDLLVGAVQAYIFAVLATVFIGAAVSDGAPREKEKRPA